MMEGLIEEYYLSKNVGETKFYMYRVVFGFGEVVEILKFLLEREEGVEVVYKTKEG